MAIWTSWTGARCCAHPCRARTNRSMASTRSVCLGHLQCPVRVNQLQGATEQKAGLRLPEAVSDSEKLSTSTWVNWTNTRDGHPHPIKPRKGCDWAETDANSYDVGLFHTTPNGTEFRVTYTEVDNSRNSSYTTGVMMEWGMVFLAIELSCFLLESCTGLLDSISLK